MRVLVAAALVTAALAGCADPAPVVASEVFEYRPGPGSHPAYGLPVRGDLPMVGQETPGWPEGWKQPQGLPLPDAISGLVPRGDVRGVESGSGITIFGSYAYVGAWQSQDLWVVDISDLGAPRVVGHLEETLVGDLETIAFPPSDEHPEGRLVLVVSTRGQNLNIVDVTNATDPVLVGTIESGTGNHNHQIVPGTPIVYNAKSGDRIEIWDLSDPEDPVHVKDLENDQGCHAVDFFINASNGQFLGFCAAYEETQILDVSDPLDPKIIARTPFPIANQDLGLDYPPQSPSFSHLAMANHDGTVMIMGDETGGGSAPGCDAHARLPTGQSVTGPLGNLYFYDISDPTDPVLHGSVSPNAWDQRGSCTAHFGGVIEDRNQLVMAYYTVGVVLIDFTDLDNPYVMDQAGRDESDDPCTLCGVWDAQYYRGHVLTGDIDRGMGLLTFE